jgi:hypothetical protein
MSIIVLGCILSVMVGGGAFFALQAYQASAQLRSTVAALADAQLQLGPAKLPADPARRPPISALLTTGKLAGKAVHVLHVFNLGTKSLGLGIVINHQIMGGAVGPIYVLSPGSASDFPLRRLGKGDLIELEVTGDYDPLTFTVR